MALFLFGCAARNKTIPVIEEVQHEIVPVLEREDTDTVPNTVIQQLELVDIDSLIIEAQKACNDSDFTNADTLLRRAIIALEKNEEYGIHDTSAAEDYLDSIVRMYTEVMPPEINAPDDIAILVFQRQILLSLDTLETLPNDSIVLAKLSCQKGVEYDVPVVWNERIQRSLHFYINGRKAAMERWLNRAHYYLPFMKKQFADSGLPQDLAYLPLIESGFNPLAYSPAHASGIWQFISSTGKIYGLRHNFWIDERRDPIKSTNAAIRYLKKLHNDFNDWHLALAAYNCGEGRVGRTIKKLQKDSFWELTLPRETMNYVPQYIASLMLAKSPECFGYEVTVTDTFSFDTVQVSECIGIDDIATGIGVEADTIKKLNPHILHWCTPPDMSDVTLYLPPGKTKQFKTFYANLPEEKKVTWFRYRIRRGDSLIKISRRFKLPVSAIKSVNKMRGSRIIAGRHLFIPIPANSSYVKSLNDSPSEQHETDAKGRIKYRVKRGDTVWELSELFGVSAEEISQWNNLDKASQLRIGDILVIKTKPSEEKKEDKKIPALDPGESEKYTVQSGDTPYAIALKLGISLDALQAWNNLNQQKTIYPGDVLVYSNNKAKILPETQKTQTSTTSATKNKNVIRYSVAKGDNLFQISQDFSVPMKELMALNNLTKRSILHVGDIILVPAKKQKPGNKPQKKKVQPDPSGSVVYYKVKKGDNLWQIANTFGIPVDQICEYNGLSEKTVLMPGDTIKIRMADGT